MKNLRKMIGLWVLCLFSVGNIHAEPIRKIVRYKDGTIIEGMVEKKFFTDGPMRIYSMFGEPVEWEGEYQALGSVLVGTLKSGNDFRVECRGKITSYADGVKIGNRTFSGVDKCISVSKRDVRWKLSDFRFIRMTDLSCPDIREVLFGGEYVYIEDFAESLIKKLSRVCYNGYEGKATVSFKNGNSYVGTVGISKTRKLTFDSGQGSYIDFSWANGDSYQGEAKVNEKGICYPGRGGIMTYSNEVKDRMYPGESESPFDDWIVSLYEEGKYPFEIKNMIDKRKEEMAQAERQKEHAEQKKKKEDDLHRKAACLKKYGVHWGELVYKRKLALGMTLEMCEEVVMEKKFYKVSEALIDGKKYIVWKLDDNTIKNAVLSHSENSESAFAGLFALQLAKQSGWSPYTCWIFLNGRLMAFE